MDLKFHSRCYSACMIVFSLYYTHKRGGFCKRLYRLLNALQARGATVHYLCLDAPPSALDKAVQFQRIPFPLSDRESLLFWFLFTLWCPLYAAYMAVKLRPDRYVVFNPYYSAMLVVAGCVHRAPSVLFPRVLVYRTDKLKGKPPLLRFFTGIVDRIGLRTAGTVVCMTEAMKNNLEAFCRAKFKNAKILSNDIPVPQQSVSAKGELPQEALAAARAKEEGAFIALTACMIHQVKNIDYLLDVFCEIEKSRGQRRAMLLIAGEGPLLDHYQRMVRERSITNVKFLGWCEDLTALFALTDLLIHPSFVEGVPNTVMEALAADIPALVSDIPELRELMQFEELLFNPVDRTSLMRRLEKLMSSASEMDLIRSLCVRRKAHFTFDWDDLASKLVLS